MQAIKEKQAFKVNGYPVAGIVFILGLCLLFFDQDLAYSIGVLLEIFLLCGFIMVQPNESKVLTFLGKYVGSIREDGFFWTNPLVLRKKISLRVRNFESEKIKVNDADGNPILIGAVIVWKVSDSARALFDVDNYETFVAVQSESAIRELASNYPYDSYSGEVSLRSRPQNVADELRLQIIDRLKLAGVEVIEARISHLAYAPEIAKVMLRRQQANAVIAARQKIVEGAMGMVEMVLEHLESNGVVKLDENRKALMANNLLVALVSEGDTHPVISTDTIQP